MLNYFFRKESVLIICLMIIVGGGCASNKIDNVLSTPSSSPTLCSETIKNPNLIVGDVLSLAQNIEPEDYDFVKKNGGEFVSVNEGKTFVVWWQPKDFDVTKDLVVVSLHGHESWATTDFRVWYPELVKRGYAFAGIQWWFGRSLEEVGYEDPGMIYKNIKEILFNKGIPLGHVIFQGFSMGGARSYGVALYDNFCGEKYFGVNIANSGPWEDDYPLYEKVLAKTYGPEPFVGTNWILFCGEKDDNEFGLGHVCDGMQRSYDRLTALGGGVVLFLRDPEGDHGSLMRNSANLTNVLDTVEKLF